MHLYPALRDQEGALSWYSARQNWSTERVPYCLQRVEEMLQKSWRPRRTLPKEFTIVFLRDQVYRESQLKIGWTEQRCIEMDKLAQEDHSNRLSKEEFERYQGQWYLALNKSGNNAPMRLRSDFRAAVTIKNRLHRESGEERAEPIPFQQYQRWHPSSSSDSWWKWDTSWKLVELMTSIHF